MFDLIIIPKAISAFGNIGLERGSCCDGVKRSVF